MTLENINIQVFKGKLSLAGLTNMKNAEVLPNLYNVALNETGNAIKIIRDWKRTFVGKFVYKNPKYYGMIERLERLFGHVPEWSDFTKENIDLIVDMFSQVAQSSAKTYLSMLKSVLNDAKDEINLPYPRFAERMTLKSIPSVGVYLNLSDLKKLEEYCPINDKEKIILAQFLCGCYTGARHSDVINMTVNNIDGKYLTYVSQKTKVQTTVEAKPILRKLLLVAGKHIYADSVFNETIRTICYKVGINEQMRIFRKGKYEVGEKWKFVASHTARRSFATNLAELDVPLVQIAKRMGHNDVKMTMRYIVGTISRLEDKANEFFM